VYGLKNIRIHVEIGLPPRTSKQHAAIVCAGGSRTSHAIFYTCADPTWFYKMDRLSSKASSYLNTCSRHRCLPPSTWSVNSSQHLQGTVTRMGNQIITILMVHQKVKWMEICEGKNAVEMQMELKLESYKRSRKNNGETVSRH